MSYVPYTLVKTLGPGYHRDGVTAMSFSPSARFLACGADDCSVTVWDVVTGELLQKILLRTGVLCLMWHPKEDDTLLIGRQDGTVHIIYRFNPSIENEAYKVLTGIDAPVYCFDIDSLSDYLAIGIGSEVQVARRITEHIYATFIIMPGPVPNETGQVRPRSLRFLPGGRRLIVSYLNHGVICWDILGKSPIWKIAPQPYRRIGSSAVSPDFKKILVHNLSSGMDLYEVGKKAIEHSYKLPIYNEANYPLAVGFLNNGESVVCGAQDGRIRIFDRKTGNHQQTLGHDDHLVQAICTLQSTEHAFIATAVGESGEQASIKIWQAPVAYARNWNFVMIFAKEKIMSCIEYLITTPRASSSFVLPILLAASVLVVSMIVAFILSEPTIRHARNVLYVYISDLCVVVLDAYSTVCKEIREPFQAWWLNLKPHVRQVLRRLAEDA